ncbi:MAG: DHH family phosphoesterase, partial [Catalinimonas sp.]
MEKRWCLKPTPDEACVAELSRVLNISETLTGLLVQRGVRTFETARAFFRPSLDDLIDPFLMCDMEKAVTRLGAALERGERIVVYGDYDADGTTSVALVAGFLRRFHPDVDYYLPDRHREGYGLSRVGVDWAAERGATLIITLDCGIRAVENVAYARRRGLDVIVCDHHEPGETLPDALAVLDPKRPDCDYPHADLSGCGVGLKLLWAYCLRHNVPTEALHRELDLLAVSIAADLVPMTGENRVLVYHGLRQLEQNPRPGIRMLFERAGKVPLEDGTYELDVNDLVFIVAPRLNAAGRMEHARLAVELLLADTPEAARPAAEKLDDLNQRRRAYDQQNAQEALDMIAEVVEFRDAPATVLFREGWHPGVAGIVASRCLSTHYRPTVILTAAGDDAEGRP